MPKSKKQGFSWETNSHSASHKLPFMEPRKLIIVFARFWQWIQTHAICNFLPYLSKAQCNILHLRLDLPSELCFSGFATKMLYALLISPMHATYSAHIILLDLITLIILDEACKLWSSWLCSLVQSPATFSLFDSNSLLSTLFWNTLNLCSSHSVRG